MTMAKLKFRDSVYSKDLGNSIYQQRGANFGLTMNGGMEINNRPDGITGIAQAGMIKKAKHVSEKIQNMSEAVFLGNIRSESMETGE